MSPFCASAFIPDTENTKMNKAIFPLLNLLILFYVRQIIKTLLFSFHRYRSPVGGTHDIILGAKESFLEKVTSEQKPVGLEDYSEVEEQLKKGTLARGSNAS